MKWIIFSMICSVLLLFVIGEWKPQKKGKKMAEKFDVKKSICSIEEGLIYAFAFIVLVTCVGGCLCHGMKKEIKELKKNQSYISNLGDFRVALKRSLISNDESIVIGNGNAWRGTIVVDKYGNTQPRICLTTSQNNDSILDDKVNNLYKYFDLRYEPETKKTIPAHVEEGATTTFGESMTSVYGNGWTTFSTSCDE